MQGRAGKKGVLGGRDPSKLPPKLMSNFPQGFDLTKGMNSYPNQSLFFIMRRSTLMSNSVTITFPGVSIILFPYLRFQLKI